MKTVCVVGDGWISIMGRPYREELWRRDLAEVQRASEESTKTTERLAWAILVLTLTNVVLVAVQLWVVT